MPSNFELNHIYDDKLMLLHRDVDSLSDIEYDDRLLLSASIIEDVCESIITDAPTHRAIASALKTLTDCVEQYKAVQNIVPIVEDRRQPATLLAR